MSNIHPQFSRRIVRLARVLRVGAWLWLLFLLGVQLAFWLSGEPRLLATIAGGAIGIAVQSTADKLAGLLVTLPAVLLTVYGLYRLIRMLALYEAGEIFSLTSIGHLRAFTLAIFLASVASLLESPVLAHLFGKANDAAGRHVEITIQSADIWALFISGLLFLVVHIMAEAQRIAAENAEIV